MSGIKANIFDHILYEFEMYLWTHMELNNRSSQIQINPEVNPFNKYEYNAILESHLIHFRNLLEFFNEHKKGGISVDTVLNDKRLVLPEQALDWDYAKQLVNRAVSHLSKDRWKYDGTPDDLEERQKNLPNRAFPYMFDKIKEYLGILNQRESVKEEYLNSLDDSFIQERLSDLLVLSDKHEIGESTIGITSSEGCSFLNSFSASLPSDSAALFPKTLTDGFSENS